MSKRIVLTTGMTVLIAPNSPVPWQRSVIIMLPPSLPRSFIRVSSLPLWPGGIAFSLYPTPLSLGANKAPSSSSSPLLVYQQRKGLCRAHALSH